MARMDGLQGSLKTMPMVDVCRYLSGRGASGRLQCEQGPAEKSFLLRHGRVVQASSTDPREYLGQFLINYGHINEEQLTQAFETQKETGVFLGRILVMIGIVDEPVIRQVLEVKIRESLLAVLDWNHGRFAFVEELVPEDASTVQVAVELSAVQNEAEFRRTAWQSIRAVFPSGHLGLHVHGDRIPPEPEHPLDARILDLALEGQSIDEIALTLHATPFALYQRLFALHRKGILEPVEPGSPDEDLDVEVVDYDAVPEVLGEEASVGEILECARGFLRDGKYAEAKLVAARATELAPENTSAQSLLKESETGLLAELRQQLLARPVAPRVIAGPEELSRMRFTPAERYLLKRFDGKKPVSQVIRVSPIKEVEALMLVRKFLDAGVIRLVPVT